MSDFADTGVVTAMSDGEVSAGFTTAKPSYQKFNWLMRKFWFSVRADTAAQGLTATQQYNGRTNIGAAQDKTYTTAGTGTAYTLTPDVAPTALVAGQRYRVAFHTASGATPTLSVGGLTAKSLKQYDRTGAKVDATTALGMLSEVEYDGVDYVVIDKLSSATNSMTVVSASGNYTPTTSLVRVRMVGGGGGSGGGSGTTLGGGGGGGEYREGIFTVTAGVAISCTIGAGGTAGAIGGNGGNGGATSFGALMTANGGSGGAGGGGGAGGAGGAGGQLSINGQSGTDGSSLGTPQSGGAALGGDSMLGMRRRSADGIGLAGQLYGSGGSSSWTFGNIAGATGAAGVIIVEELL